MKNILYVLGIILSWPAQLIFFKRKTYYEDKKVQSRRVKGKAIVVSNHKSFFDYMMYMFLFPFRKLYCLMSEKVYGINPFVSYLTNLLGGIRVDRTKYDFNFVNVSLDLLSKKKLLMIFPEGKLVKDKILGDFYTSYILIALKSGAPIIPLYTEAKYHILRRSRMIIGKPIYLNEYIDNINPTKEEIEYLNNIVRDKILDLKKLLEKKINEEKYHKAFSFKKFFYDLGRLQTFFVRIAVRFKVYNFGKKKYKLKQKDNLLIISNHLSLCDPLIMINLYWRRRIHIMVADVIYNNHKIRSKLLNSLGCIKIKRDEYDYEAMNQAMEILDSKGVVMVFPEGHLSPNELSQFRFGAAYLAAKTYTNILPVYIVKRKNKLSRFKVYLGDIIEIDKNKKYKSKDLDDLNNLMFDEMKKLENKYKK